MDNKSIDGKELRDLIIKNKATSIPFEMVSGGLYLRNTPIKNLGNLQEISGGLYLRGTPLSKKYSEEEIREQVSVGGNIYM